MVECAGLEIQCTFRRTVGSNPTLSARIIKHVQDVSSRFLAAFFSSMLDSLPTRQADRVPIIPFALVAYGSIPLVLFIDGLAKSEGVRVGTLNVINGS